MKRVKTSYKYNIKYYTEFMLLLLISWNISAIYYVVYDSSFLIKIYKDIIYY